MIQIRHAHLRDAAVIAEFNQAMAQETEDKQLPAETINAGVERMLADSTLGFYLVAQAPGNDNLAGCLGITTEWSDWRNGLFWWIQSVYVPPEFRGQGVFSALYKHVKGLATSDEEVCGIRLYAEKQNQQALRTYFRLGMIETEYRLLEELF